MKTPIAIQLTKNENGYFKNYESPIETMCSAFASALNPKAENARKIEFKISRSPFKGSQQIFSSRFVVGKKKNDGRSFGLPFEGAAVGREMFGIELDTRQVTRFYVNVEVLA